MKFLFCLKDLNHIFHGLLQAIETLHRNGCVHGGIAAGNILIKKVNNDIIPILKEPNFSKNEVLIVFYIILPFSYLFSLSFSFWDFPGHFS